MIIVNVIAGNSDNAIKLLKRRLQQELYYSKMKKGRHHEPLSVKKVRKQQESRRRVLKSIRKRISEEY